jgi:hypothetical protein
MAGMAWLRTIDRNEAEGALRAAYDAMAARPMPSVYRAPHGGAPGILRAHSLDAELLRCVFATSGTLHAGELSWADRELVSAVAARTSECFY